MFSSLSTKWVSTFSLFSINLGPILHSLVLSLVIDHKRSILESSNFYFAFYIFFGYQQFELSIFLKEIEIKGFFAKTMCKIPKISHINKKKTFLTLFKFGQNVPLVRHCAPPPYGQPDRKKTIFFTTALRGLTKKVTASQ